MAAYAALLSLMQLIHDIQNHHSPPISLDMQQVESLTEKVTFLLEFLETYTSPLADIDDEADPLEIRIADAAYAAEDVIEFYIVHLIKLSRSTRGKETKSTLSCINLYEDLHQVIEEMDLIIKVAVKIHAEKVPTSSSSASSSSFLSSSSSSTPMVCSVDVLNGIMEKLVRGRPHRHAIPITGMGGIGKTTLARNLYAHQVIKEYFDICFWATISQQYNTKQILCELVLPKEDQSGRSVGELRSKSVDELGLELHKYLFGRRFLIVMDDMWSIDAWDEIQCFFPNNENGSRILVTTRLSHLGSQLNNNYSLQMQFLDEDSSWHLFSQTVFGKETCPLELVGIGKKIAENCGGLPLSIVVVGGLLKKMERTPRCWESIRNNLTSVVSLENDKHCLRLLKLSYDHLPLYLKPCFLYMGVFEEDCRIESERLIRLWISEGFLKPINGKSLETIAIGFLEELVDRNLVFSHENRYHKIHDLVRDMCLRESKKYGFYDVIGGEGSPQGINSQRRVVILSGTSEEKVCDALQSISHTRSVICEKSEVPLCGDFGLVRTLDIRAVFSELESNSNGHVFESCVNLRHLVVNVGVCSMSLLLSSLNVFWNLQTLIVCCWDECNIAPIGIWKMPQLRHIQFNRNYPLCVLDLPSEGKDDVVVMENLEILEGVKNLKFGEEVVKRIPNVKKLGIRYEDDDDDIYCVGNIKYLCKLESLYVRCGGEKFACLHKLTFPHSLKNLTLGMHRKVEWEKMMLERIGSLPLLESLEMKGGCFKRGKWEIGEDQFPCLKYLTLWECKGLKEWTMAQESCSIFPRLEYLFLWKLEELKEIPREIGEIPTLQKIELDRCSESVVRSAKEIVEEQMEYQGEEHLPFHVEVRVHSHRNDAAAQQSLAGPNFVVLMI